MASAIYYGGRAIVINPLGVHTNAINGYDPAGADITSYISRFDFLGVVNAVFRPRLYGSRRSQGAAGFHGIDDACALVGCY